jgi:hypothetical protein
MTMGRVQERYFWNIGYGSGVLMLHLQNIDFQTTILSRFDMIFIVRDEHNETRDKVTLSRCLVDDS